MKLFRAILHNRLMAVFNNENMVRFYLGAMFSDIETIKLFEDIETQLVLLTNLERMINALSEQIASQQSTILLQQYINIVYGVFIVSCKYTSEYKLGNQHFLFLFDHWPVPLLLLDNKHIKTALFQQYNRFQPTRSELNGMIDYVKVKSLGFFSHNLTQYNALSQELDAWISKARAESDTTTQKEYFLKALEVSKKIDWQRKAIERRFAEFCRKQVAIYLLNPDTTKPIKSGDIYQTDHPLQSNLFIKIPDIVDNLFQPASTYILVNAIYQRKCLNSLEAVEREALILLNHQVGIDASIITQCIAGSGITDKENEAIIQNNQQQWDRYQQIISELTKNKKPIDKLEAMPAPQIVTPLSFYQPQKVQSDTTIAAPQRTLV